MNNPWETYPETISTILRQKHICPTYWDYEAKDVRADGEVEPTAKKAEYWVNETCATDACEYCAGWRYNEWFTEKPTESEISEMLMKNTIKCDLAKKVKRKKKNGLLFSGTENDGQLISLSIDQKYIQIPKLCGDIIAEIRKTNYACLKDAQAVCEFYGGGKDNDDGIGQWNPHIHIVTKKMENAGTVAQLLRRKFIKPKWQVYRVHIKEEPEACARKYVEGEKVDEKIEDTIKDRQYREDNGLSHIYDL